MEILDVYKMQGTQESLVTLLQTYLPVNANIFNQLPLNSLLALCASQSDIRRVCEQDSFWKQRVTNDFKLENLDNNSISPKGWKDYYIGLYLNSTLIDLYRDNVLVDSFRISTQDITQINTTLKELYSDTSLTLYTDVNKNVIAVSTPEGESILDQGNSKNMAAIYVYTSVDPQLLQFVNSYISISNAFKPLSQGEKWYVINPERFKKF